MTECAWCGCEKDRHAGGSGLCNTDGCECRHYAEAASPLRGHKSTISDIREYERSKIGAEATVKTLLQIATSLAAKHQSELVNGLREILKQKRWRIMKLQRYEFIPGPMGGEMRAMEDGDYCESSEVEQLEHVAQLVLISPATGKPLEVCSDLLEEGSFTVFYVSNTEERFKVKISMEEM